jgi:hypothetical protein
MSDQDRPGENRGELPGSPPASFGEILAPIQAQIDEIIALLERRAAHHD